MDENQNNEKVKKYLVALLTLFKDKPNILAQYLIDYDALRDDFIDVIVNNDRLNDVSRSIEDSEDINKPYFKTMDEMNKFYGGVFKKKDIEFKKHPILEAETEEESLNKQLDEAIRHEDYEKASLIRDYMIIRDIPRKNY